MNYSARWRKLESDGAQPWLRAGKPAAPMDEFRTLETR